LQENVEQVRDSNSAPESEKCLKAAIREVQKSGAKDLGLAERLDRLAALYRDEKKYARSEAFYKQSLGIKEEILGPWDLSVAAALDNLAGVIASQGKHERAEPFDRRAHEIRDRALATHPDVYVNGVRKPVVPPQGLADARP